MTTRPSDRLEALQALRAIAAAFVVLLHAFYTYAEKISPMDPISGVGLHYDLATFGVKLFFCISGFIIFKSTVGLDPGLASASHFALRRLIRIVPLYWAVTAIYAVKLGIQGMPPGALDVVRSLLFVPYADARNEIRPVLGAGWTLNFEMLFYAALCFALVLRRQWRFMVVAAIFAALLAAGLAGVAPSHYENGATAWGLMADTVLLFFLAGMCVAAVTHRYGVRGPLPGTLVGGIALIAAVMLGFTVPAAVFGLDALGGAKSLPVVLLEVAVCFALVYVGVKPYTHSGRGVDWMVAAGDGSYSTYLVHGFVMGPAARVVSKFGVSLGPWPFAILMVVVCTAVGVLVYKLFEHPLQKWMNARWAGQRHRSSTAAAAA